MPRQGNFTGQACAPIKPPGEMSELALPRKAKEEGPGSLPSHMVLLGSHEDFFCAEKEWFLVPPWGLGWGGGASGRASELRLALGLKRCLCCYSILPSFLQFCLLSISILCQLAPE